MNYQNINTPSFNTIVLKRLFNVFKPIDSAFDRQIFVEDPRSFRAIFQNFFAQIFVLTCSQDETRECAYKEHFHIQMRLHTCPFSILITGSSEADWLIKYLF